MNRREEVVLSHLHIGHTHLTQAYLLKGEDQPECVACQCLLTVKHILIECADFLQIREKYDQVHDMRQLFEDINIGNIFEYLREIRLFHRI